MAFKRSAVRFRLAPPPHHGDVRKLALNFAVILFRDMVISEEADA